tara:strand:+ start:200 stop:700 length:501 start_codon:yes stop_codon:yes gene_type:complete
VGEKKYALSPVQTRGIPHGYVPGVHSVLEDYVTAVDRVATEFGHGTADTTNGLFSLPYSAWTQARLLWNTIQCCNTYELMAQFPSQALRPDVESTSDSTLRHCFREPREISCAIGRSYLPDATAESEARANDNTRTLTLHTRTLRRWWRRVRTSDLAVYCCAHGRQ